MYKKGHRIQREFKTGFQINLLRGNYLTAYSLSNLNLAFIMLHPDTLISNLTSRINRQKQILLK